MMGCANFRGRCVNLFGKSFVENCMKMKEIGPRGGHASLAPPLGSANECKLIKQIFPAIVFTVLILKQMFVFHDLIDYGFS